MSKKLIIILFIVWAVGCGVGGYYCYAEYAFKQDQERLRTYVGLKSVTGCNYAGQALALAERWKPPACTDTHPSVLAVDGPGALPENVRALTEHDGKIEAASEMFQIAEKNFKRECPQGK